MVVEAAAEADLQADTRIFSGLDGLMDALEVIVNRLLAEDVLACFGRLDDELCVRVRRGGNDDGLDFRILQDILCIFRHVLDAELLHIGSSLIVHERICDRLDRESRDKQGDVADMDFADAAGTNDTNFHDKPSLPRFAACILLLLVSMYMIIDHSPFVMFLTFLEDLLVSWQVGCQAAIWAIKKDNS